MNALASGLAIASFSTAALAQAVVTAPAAHATSDAVRHLWLAGAGADMRQQVLIGASHLGALVGEQLTAIELRRDANGDAFSAGAAHWTVTLSSSSAGTYDASPTFAANVGADAVQVFDGQVTFPASPAAAGPAVAWTADNVVRVAFQTPFAYAGGRLCVDITGAAVPGQESFDWLPDAHCEDPTGSAVTLGGGCGPYATQAYVDDYGLSVGSAATFSAGGTPNVFAFAMTGPALAAPVPLSLIGWGAPYTGCAIRVDPLSVTPVLLPDLLGASMGIGAWRLPIPNDGALQGLGFATQWLDWATRTTTDAIAWTVGARYALDMATVEGDLQATAGHRVTNTAFVVRVEHL
ncbi:MAG: hypothetical protein ACON4Z_12775 [Planctomycetota bacterium]